MTRHASNFLVGNAVSLCLAPFFSDVATMKHVSSVTDASRRFPSLTRLHARAVGVNVITWTFYETDYCGIVRQLCPAAIIVKTGQNAQYCKTSAIAVWKLYDTTSVHLNVGSTTDEKSS